MLGRPGARLTTSFDVIVIGAGLSGLMAAGAASQAGARVALLEKQSLPGRKYLLAAMGKGALSNLDLGLHRFHGRDARFVSDALAALPQDELRRWFARQGVDLVDGPHYGLIAPPQGPDSALAALVAGLGDATFLPEHRAAAVTRGKTFAVTLDDGRRFHSDRLILAMGLPNLPQCGGELTGLEIAQRLGHRVEPVFAAHVPLALEEPWLSDLCGLWLDVDLALRTPRRELARSTGSLLFTQSGLTGQAVFNVAREAGPALEGAEHLTLTVNFFPGESPTEVARWMHEAFGSHTRENAYVVFDRLIPRALGDRLLRRQKVKPTLRAEQLEHPQREGLLRDLTELQLNVRAPLGMAASERARGGVSLREIDPRTMQSRKVPGLFVVGSMLDLSCDWGGHAQHFALASGLLAGRAAGRALDAAPTQG